MTAVKEAAIESMGRSAFTAPLILVVVAVIAVTVWAGVRFDTLEESIEHIRPPDEPSGATAGELPRDIVAGQTVYVSIYSHVYQQEGGRLTLTGTLSIRNTDADLSITISAVKYYDTTGKLVRDYLDSPLVVRPLGSTDFMVKQSDMAGGIGANFIVEWVANKPVLEPVIEAVMVGRSGTGLCTFLCPGRVLRELRPEDGE